MSDRKERAVSHIHLDDAGLPDLMDLLVRHGMEVRNYSVTSDKENNAKSPDHIKKRIGILFGKSREPFAMIVPYEPLDLPAREIGFLDGKVRIEFTDDFGMTE